MYVEDECDHVLSLLLGWYSSKITHSTKVWQKSLGNYAETGGGAEGVPDFFQVTHSTRVAKPCVTKPGKPWHIPYGREMTGNNLLNKEN